MEKKRYRNSYYGIFNIALLVITIMTFTMCRDNRPKYVDECIDSTWINHAPFIVLDISYKDSLYKVLIREDELYRFPDLYAMKYRRTIFDAIKEPVKIDSSQWNYFVKFNRFVTPQNKVDCVYRGDINNLVQIVQMSYNGYNLYKWSDSEVNYIISLCFQNGVYIATNCVSGFMIIVNKEELGLPLNY